MTECAAEDVRDLLPDLLHGTLGRAETAAVRAHLVECEGCREELVLLEAARDALAAEAPVVDVGRIVAALPSPPARPVRRRELARPRAASLPPSVGSRGRGWRRRSTLAALAAALLVGALGVWSAGGPGVGSVPAGDTLAAARATGPATAAPPTGLSFAGGVGDLPPDELMALLADLESLELAPAAEPDLVDWTMSDVGGD